jgi:predicted enzyme related to lactoylglutathione lyase
VKAEAERLASLGAAIVRVLTEPRDDHYAIAMTDPEGNEFDIN